MEMATKSKLAEEWIPFWAGTSKGFLQFPRCVDCGQFHWYPLKICPYCQSDNIKWSRVTGHGKVFTWTVVRHVFDPPFADKIPYIVALIEFKDAPRVRLVANIVEVEPAKIQIGMDVEPVFSKVNEDLTLVFFKPAGA